MKLYVYEHCPYCNRVMMLIGLKKLNIDVVILPYDDEETPTKMIGQKMLPILEKNDGSFMAESMDIVRYLDRLDQPIIQESSNTGIVTEAITSMQSAVYRIAMPRWATLPLREFKTEEAKRYYINRKTLSIGSFEDAISNTEKYQEVIVSSLKTLNSQLENGFGEHFIHQELTEDDFYLFPILHSLTAYRKFLWVETVFSYVKFMAEKTKIHIYTK